MKRLIAIAVLTASAAAPTALFAQFSMPTIPGLGKPAGGAPADLGGQQDSLMRNFSSANKDVLTANAKMAEALGLKDQATSAQTAANSLTEGATKDNLSDANKAVADTGGAIAAAMAKKPELDAASKATFATGLVSLLSGVTRYVGLSSDVKNMSMGLKGASPMQMPKLGSALYVVSNFPSSASQLSKAVQNATAFAKENGIAVPANSADAMGALGAL
jgi:hypothetical protein